MKKFDIPIEEFEIVIREDGAYRLCKNCGKLARDQEEEGIAKLNFCPECGKKFEE